MKKGKVPAWTISADDLNKAKQRDWKMLEGLADRLDEVGTSEFLWFATAIKRTLQRFGARDKEVYELRKRIETLTFERGAARSAWKQEKKLTETLRSLLHEANAKAIEKEKMEQTSRNYRNAMGAYQLRTGATP